MDGLLDGFRLRPPFFFSAFRGLLNRNDTFSRENAVLKINLLGKGLTQGISGDRSSP